MLDQNCFEQKGKAKTIKSGLLTLSDSDCTFYYNGMDPHVDAFWWFFLGFNWNDKRVIQVMNCTRNVPSDKTNPLPSSRY